MGFNREAFRLVFPDAKQPEQWYVTLYRRCQQWGGPEEGGWYRTVCTVEEYGECLTERDAHAMAEAVERKAEELGRESRRQHGERCLREMEWCDARGLDADYLPEPDGPDEFFVRVEQQLGASECSGPSHYE